MFIDVQAVNNHRPTEIAIALLSYGLTSSLDLVKEKGRVINLFPTKSRAFQKNGPVGSSLLNLLRNTPLITS